MNKRLKEIDSLRGIAIILVMAFHIFKRANYFTKHETLYLITNLSFIGWIGVDIFFTLSGFLITSILLQTKDNKSYFKKFYIRRVLRIFPLYYFFIATILAFTPILIPEYTKSIFSILPFLLFYLQNWIGYFGIPELPGYLSVTWSLAIEEQFYLIWPAVVYYMKRQTLVKTCISIIIISILWRLYGSFVWEPSTVAKFFYFNTFTRFEELIFGALLAIFMTDPTLRDRIRFLAVPIFCLSLSLFLTLCIKIFPALIPIYGSSASLTPWSYTLIPLFSTALIAILLTYPENFFVRRVFQNKILEFFGKYSYSMYLLHMPIALILLELLYNTHIRGWKMYLLYIVSSYAITIIGSLLTWNLLEKHMLNLKKYFEYRETTPKTGLTNL